LQGIDSAFAVLIFLCPHKIELGDGDCTMNIVPTKKTFYALWIPQYHYIINGRAVSFLAELTDKFGLAYNKKLLFNSKEEAIKFAEIILNDYLNRSDKITDISWAVSLDQDTTKKCGVLRARKELGRLLKKGKEIPTSFCTKHRFLDDFEILSFPEGAATSLKLARKTEIMLFTNKPEKKTIVVDGVTFESSKDVEICTGWHPHMDEEINIFITKDEQMFIENASSEADGSKG